MNVEPDRDELRSVQVLRRGPKITRMTGYNGIGIGIETPVARMADPRPLAYNINNILDLLAWSLGLEVLDAAVKYVQVRPPSYEKPKVLYLEISDAKGRVKNVSHTWKPKKPSMSAQYILARKHVHLFKGESDSLIDPSDITHEVGHGIEELLPNKVKARLKRKHQRLVEHRLLPEIRKGRTPLAVSYDVLTPYAFIARPDSDVITQHGEIIAYKGYVGRLSGVWMGDPGGVTELQSLRIVRDWIELFPELFTLYMLRPDELMRKSSSLFYFTKRTLEDLVGEQVIPITQ